MSALRRHTELVTGIYAGLALLIAIGEIAVALQREALLLQTLLEPRLGQALAAAGIACAAVMMLGGLTVFALQRARPARSRGRGRLWR